MKGEDRVELRIRVRPSPETNDHEVLLFGDEQNLVDRFGDGSIGLDPDDILVEPCPLLGEKPHECLIGRCDCGVIGCGDVQVRISAREDMVSWAAVHDHRAPVHFELRQYQAEVHRALNDSSWETPERTASRLIRVGVDHQLLARSRLTFSWASGRAAPSVMTVALRLEPGPYQLLVRLPWKADAPETIADIAIGLFARSPSFWPDVDWIPQAPTLGPPAIAGSGWRRYRP